MTFCSIFRLSTGRGSSTTTSSSQIWRCRNFFMKPLLNSLILNSDFAASVWRRQQHEWRFYEQQQRWRYEQQQRRWRERRLHERRRRQLLLHHLVQLFLLVLVLLQLWWRLRRLRRCRRQRRRRRRRRHLRRRQQWRRRKRRRRRRTIVRVPLRILFVFLLRRRHWRRRRRRPRQRRKGRGSHRRDGGRDQERPSNWCFPTCGKAIRLKLSLYSYRVAGVLMTTRGSTSTATGEAEEAEEDM